MEQDGEKKKSKYGEVQVRAKQKTRDSSKNTTNIKHSSKNYSLKKIQITTEDNKIHKTDYRKIDT